MPAGLLQIHQGQIGPVDPDPGPPELPGGAAQVVRFFMEMPPWVQIWGAVLGGVVALVAAVILWRRRREIPSWTSAALAWIRAVPTAVRAGAVAVLVAGVALGSVGGYQVYDFVEHDNRFCTGCHLMAEAYMTFEESAHSGLGCKDCHYQSKAESMRQLYLWVTHRPDEVPPHSPVPDVMCTSCHIDEDPDQWPQVAASLGHRVHFESDDPDLGELMCVTCHGVSVHEFAPADATCGECHEAEAEIRLGRMTGEAELHCVTCHHFLGDTPATLPGVPEGLALVPDRPQCQSCHQMAGLLEDAELDVDPHGAVCGACHNPHTQDAPEGAVETCLGCHDGADTITVFHTGTHAPVLPDCIACHSAHRWTVDGTDCLSCHETVMDEPRGPQAGGWPAPESREWVTGGATLDTPAYAAPAYGNGGPDGSGWGTAPGIRSSPLRLIHGLGDVRSVPGARPAPTSAATPTPADTLPRPLLHRQHEAVSCTECHGRAGEHGVITVRTPRECAACHHDPARGFECADCHPGEALAVPRQVSATMALTVWDEPRTRDLSFEHETHDAFQCQECHTGPVLLAVQRECADCHDDHHRPEADCARCHQPTEPDVHGLEVHLTCTSSGCHAGTAGERPALTRNLCLACHQEQLDHEPGLECQRCHMVPDQPPVRREAGPTISPRPGTAP